MIYATAGYPNLFDTASGNLPFTGLSLQAATAHFPLNNFLNNKFWAGLSLFKLFALGYNQFTFSVLPLRFGYREYLIAEDLTFEPQLELNYYPSRYINVSARLRLNTFKDQTIGFVVGYANGTTGVFLPSLFNKLFFKSGSKVSSDFSSFYLGVSIGLKDRLNTPEKVREMDKWEESR